MEETGREQESLDAPAAPRPAWVDEQSRDVLDQGPRRRERPVRQPVPGRHADDGLWLHAAETGVLIVVTVFIAALAIPHSVAWGWITGSAAVLTAVTGYVALDLTGSLPVSSYLAAWGALITGWITAARLASPWNGEVIFMLVLPAAVLILIGVPVIRRWRARASRAAELGLDTANTRECRHWEDLLARAGITGARIRDVLKVDGGYRVLGRLGKLTADGRRVSGIEAVLGLAPLIAQHKRLPKGSVYIEESPHGGTSADFIIHVTTSTGPRLSRFLPAENHMLSITRPFALGVLDTGREFTLKLREVVVFVVGLRGSGKSTLLNVMIAQLCRMPDALVFMIDLKGGQEARAWLMPWIRGWTDRPAIDWLATNRAEADIMLDALKRAGYARAESGKYGKKLRPSPQAPAIIPVCDETTVMTGHFLREDGLSNTKLAVKLLQIAETFRSVGIDPVVAAVRAVVDATGNSGIKAMAEVRIGMKVATAEEGRQIFPDNLAAARQLALLKDKGSGIPKVGADLYPPVHFFNITDGEPDDDGHPTEDRITPIVMATADRRPEPEQLIVDAMGDAYANRWEQPHIRQLIDTWRREDGVPGPPPQPSARRPAAGSGSGDGEDADFDRWAAEMGDLNASLDSGDLPPGHRMNPVRRRMYELLIEAGPLGLTSGMLWTTLMNAGLDVTRQTVCTWLDQANRQGIVYRSGKPKSGRARWIWRLPEGGEFDLPGWS